MAYPDALLDHYQNPRHKGRLEGAAIGHIINPLCGDEVTVYVGDGRVTFDGVGCAISLGAADLVCQAAEAGKSIQTDDLWIERLLGMELSPGRKRCGSLAAEAYLQAMTSKD